MYCTQNNPIVLRKNAMSLKPYQDPVDGGGDWEEVVFWVVHGKEYEDFGLVGWLWRQIVWQTGTTAWETRCFFLQGTKRKDGGKRFLWNIATSHSKKTCTISLRKHDMAQLSTLMLRCLSIPLLNLHYIQDSVRTLQRTVCFHWKRQSLKAAQYSDVAYWQDLSEHTR